jgi:hypothetical protein
MGKALPLEYDEVQSVIDTGSQESDWVRREFSGVDLRDKRLNRRVVKVAQLFAKSPTAPINEASGGWTPAHAAYRFFRNIKVTLQRILNPHVRATANRMKGHDGPILVVQDTTFLSYGQHPKTRGLGTIGKSNESTDRGLVMHNALAFTTAGVPLGVLSQHTWARKDVPDETRQQKVKRLNNTSLDKKESFKWLVALKETVERTPKGVKIITVADRESDFYELIAEATHLRTDFIFRARVDRKLVPEESENCTSILDAFASAAVLGTVQVDIPSNGQRKARTAMVSVRTARVVLRPPNKQGAAKRSATFDPIAVNVVWATEEHSPSGEEALSWVLLTSLAVPDFERAAEVIQWYGKRWGIETWHKVLKSGCKVEDCMLETGERLIRYLALFSVIAVRLMYITFLARAQPKVPATEVFSDLELAALHIRVKKTAPPAKSTLTTREAIRMIGALGGHLGRECDKEPGIVVLWRGLTRLYEDVDMMCACQAAFIGAS